MEHFYKNIPGWFDYQSLYKDIVIRAPNGAHFVEVGSYLGCSAAFMGVEIHNSGKNIKFDAVDVFELEKGSPFANFYKREEYLGEFLKNIAPVANWINTIKGSSVEISKKYKDNSLDFVF